MVTNIILAVAALLAVFLVVVALRPSTYRVSRSISVNASPGTVFDHVNVMQRWQKWSPFENVDPAMKRVFEGPEAGGGAVYRWEGNHQIGTGSNTIVESRPNELIRFKLEMLKPHCGTNDVDFQFQPDAQGTKVTWTMQGRLNFITKIIDLIIGMDAMIGRQFQEGLKQLKLVAENEPA
ncbi:SRPBCC family protein [Schlesneria sp.]|uniref:SRPBCC family protein n=1 Tax=Schlesneria sp. TaxID=2762018 RepID=UPI002EE8AE3E